MNMAPIRVAINAAARDRVATRGGAEGRVRAAAPEIDMYIIQL